MRKTKNSPIPKQEWEALRKRIIHMRNRKNHTWRQIGDSLGISYETARKIYNYRKHPGESKTKWKKYIPAWIKAKTEEGRSLFSLGKEYGVSPSVIYYHLNKRGIDTSEGRKRDF